MVLPTWGKSIEPAKGRTVPTTTTPQKKKKKHIIYASAAIQSKTRPAGRRPQNTTVQIWYLNTFSDLFTVEIEPSCIEHIFSGAMLLVRIVGSPPHDKSEAILLVS